MFVKAVESLITQKIMILVTNKSTKFLQPNLLNSLMFGFMLTTSFLSMWISNTATTAMMLPIVEAVFNELKASESTEEVRNLILK